MKKIKKLIIFVLFALFIPMGLFGCNEVTFESTPWNSSTETQADITTKLYSNKQYMMKDLGIPVSYRTTTNYNFYSTQDGAFSNKNIKDETITTFSNGTLDECTALVQSTRSVNGQMIESSTTTYVKSSSGNFAYYTNTIYQDPEDETTLSRESANITNNTFFTMLGDIVLEARTNETNSVQTKTFDGVTYYKLSSSIAGLEVVNNRFTGNSDIFNTPNLFQVYQSGVDYVISFDYQYGFNASNYITYFAMNYTVENSSRVYENKWETYMSVNTVTKLETFGTSVTTPTEPEDKDLYTLATFNNIVSQNEHYVTYKDNNVAGEAYNRITVTKQPENKYLVRVEEIDATNEITSSKYYYVVAGESNLVYSIDTVNRTYTLTDEYTPTFLEINYSRPYSSTTGSVYMYGSGENITLITMRDNEVYMVSNGTRNSSISLYVLDFKTGAHSFVSENNIDISTYSLVVTP